MKTPCQPLLQAGLGTRKVHTADANLRECKLASPELDLGNELSAVERHNAIVETRTLHSEADTQALAGALASQAALRRACIELHGNLGAGKTTLVRHLLHALGVSGRIKSPTYAVVEPYEIAGLPIWHFDFYRFSDPREWEDAGFRDIFASPGLKLCEWPEKATGLLPVPDLSIDLQAQPDESRRATLTANTELGRTLLGSLPAEGRA